MYAFIQDSAVQAFPYSIQEFRNTFPLISLPENPTVEQLEELGIFEVIENTPTFDSNTHRAEELLPKFVDGKWTQQWQLIPLSESEIAMRADEVNRENRKYAKAQRELEVSSIKVTTSTGKTFDGDEVSQTRMARAIIALQATGTPTVTWVLADNTPTQASVEELVEALALAGAAQAAIWVIE